MVTGTLQKVVQKQVYCRRVSGETNLYLSGGLGVGRDGIKKRGQVNSGKLYDMLKEKIITQITNKR